MQSDAQVRSISERAKSENEAPPYAALLKSIAADIGAITRAAAADVAEPRDDPTAVVADVRVVVERLVSLLAFGPEPSARAIGALRGEGASAARAGIAVERVIDRYLSAAWVIYAAAAASATDTAALASLGGALLRTGDVAAAAIAQGQVAVERELAAREAASRGDLLDSLLDLHPGDPMLPSAMRGSSLLGLEPDAGYRVIVASSPKTNAEPDARRVVNALARSSRSPRTVTPLAGVRHDRLVLVVPQATSDPAIVAALNAGHPRPWFAAGTGTIEGLAAVSGAYANVLPALQVAERLERPGQLVSIEAVLLERSLLADERLLAAAVSHELGPIQAARRGGPMLVETVRVWLDEGQNAHAAARSLRVAPRTVAYRLDRVARLLGHPLDGDAVRRLSTAILGLQLLGESSGSRRTQRIV